MNSTTRMMSMRMAVLATLMAIVVGMWGASARAQDESGATADVKRSFAEAVDLRAFGSLAVQTEGRIKSLDSFARGMMQTVSGPRSINGQSATFTYIDMMLRPDAYAKEPVIYVKLALLRADLARVLNLDEAASEQVIRSGLFTLAQISDTRSQRLLAERRTDVLKTEKFVSMIDNAMTVRDPAFLWRSLTIAPPPTGGLDQPWITLEAFGTDKAHREQSAATTRAWELFSSGWLAQNANVVNEAAGQLVNLLPAINPEVYPAREKLEWESWYFNSGSMIWIWLLYGAALAPLLLSVVFKWNGARWLGLGLFAIALGFHTFAVGLRWYVSGRWPNSNMFEAITTAAWFGGVAALVLETLVRRTPMRSLFALGACAASMTGWMAVKFFPLELNANISNMMPVLHDIWLYIHTNVIIFSYCLIFIAAVTAALYLGYRLCLLMGVVGGSSGIRATDEYARVGGAGSLILTKPDGTRVLESAKTTFGQVLDGTTMVVMELSFVMLWVGLVMGAIWADHSWGRPWGWDPKEVFALNTFIIFLLLVHVRLKVKDKGLWTAVLAVFGAGVMIFNWVIINFTISGLHSYA